MSRALEQAAVDKALSIATSIMGGKPHKDGFSVGVDKDGNRMIWYRSSW